jgi:hypothetical protein
MIDDALVREVTQEILKLLKNSTGAPAPAADRPKLLLAGPVEVLSEDRRAWLDRNFELVPLSGLNVAGWPKAPLLLTSLSLQALVQTASGDEGCTTEGRALLSALLDGRPAVAVAEGTASRRLPRTTPRVFASLYQTAETILRNAGLAVVSEKDVPAALARSDAAGPAGAAFREGTTAGPTPAPGAFPSAGSAGFAGAAGTGGSGGTARKGRVLTESIVAALFPEADSGRLELKPGDVLTPLAKDHLSAKRIPVIKEQA